VSKFADIPVDYEDAQNSVESKRPSKS
jgi:hypothetical protein